MVKTYNVSFCFYQNIRRKGQFSERTNCWNLTLLATRAVFHAMSLILRLGLFRFQGKMVILKRSQSHYIVINCHLEFIEDRRESMGKSLLKIKGPRNPQLTLTLTNVDLLVTCFQIESYLLNIRCRCDVTRSARHVQ